MFRMNRLGIPQDRIAKRLGQIRETIRNHLAKMPELANQPNADLSRGFTVAQVAEKHGWTEPMVWSLALERKDDLQRFKELDWGLRTWDTWEWNDCLPREIHVNDKQSVFHRGDRRFGDEWPGRIPGQMIAHILYYFRSKVTWPSIPIIFDPHYFDKKRDDYSQKSISTLPRQEYLAFLESLFAFMKGQGKKTTRLAFINADWRDFQNTPAAEETHEGSILIDDYLSILNKTGWQRTHIIQAPLSTQSFIAGIVSAVQKNRILGVTSWYMIALKQ